MDVAVISTEGKPIVKEQVKRPRHTTSGKHRDPQRRKSPLALRIIGWVLVGLLVLFGGWVLIQTLVTGEPPKEVAQPINKIVSDAKVEIEKVQNDGLVSVQLGGVGGQLEMDACDGTFIEFPEYQLGDPELPPTFIAHNGCRGDVILGLEAGSKLNIIDREGVTSKYSVIETRNVPQVGSDVELLEGMKGDMLLQSCFWDDYTMHFVAVVKDEVQPKN